MVAKLIVLFVRLCFTSNLVMREVSLYDVQKLLGHKKVDQAMKYAHLGPDFISDSVKRLDVI